MPAAMPEDTYRLLGAIYAIPLDTLPNGNARETLYALAFAGVEMNVYQHAAGEWVIWLRPAERWQDGRYTLAEWERDYAQLAGEALARLTGKVGAA
jgi:hypothetical protein